MGKHFAVMLFCFIPGIAFSQSQNDTELGDLYRQVDSLEFSISLLRDSVKRSNILWELKNKRDNKEFEYYRALVRLEKNRLSAQDSLLLNISSTSYKNSRGVVKTVTTISVTTRWSVEDTAGVDSLLADFPKLLQQYRKGQLEVQSGPRHMKIESLTMDLPSIPKMPNATTAQAKKILADRMLYWMTNACGTLHCTNDLTSMLEEEKKSKMSIDQVIASRRLFIEYVTEQNAKSKL